MKLISSTGNHAGQYLKHTAYCRR